jgi:hypothetical protein
VKAKSYARDEVAGNESLSSYIDHVENVLIIGDDNSTNHYVLNCTEGAEAVYFHDRYHSYDDKISIETGDIDQIDECGVLYKISDSFSDFYQLILKSLKSNA